MCFSLQVQASIHPICEVCHLYTIYSAEMFRIKMSFVSCLDVWSMWISFQGGPNEDGGDLPKVRPCLCAEDFEWMKVVVVVFL